MDLWFVMHQNMQLLFSKIPLLIIRKTWVRFSKLGGYETVELIEAYQMNQSIKRNSKIAFIN